jgi:hypothetical protein
LRLLRLPLALGLVLLSSASSVRAAGLNLAWDKCLSEGGGIAKTFDCGSNQGYADIVGSFIPSQPHPRFVAFEVKLDVQSQARTLPAWGSFSTAARAASPHPAIRSRPASRPGPTRRAW